LISEVAELTNGLIQLGPGTLYRSLQRMRVDGLIEELADNTVAETTDRRAERRRNYRITQAGRIAARAEARRLSVFLQAARQRGVFEPAFD
jgi:DNA-binding PadR family transcriptional regulator